MLDQQSRQVLFIGVICGELIQYGMYLGSTYFGSSVGISQDLVAGSDTRNGQVVLMFIDPLNEVTAPTVRRSNTFIEHVKNATIHMTPYDFNYFSNDCKSFHVSFHTRHHKISPL